MFCKNCGAQVPDGTRFCTVCGAALTESVNPEQNYSTPGEEPVSRESGSYKEEPFVITNVNTANAGGGSAQQGFNPNESYQNPSFGEAIRSFFIRYIDFSGRSSRAEYWFVFLMNFIVTSAIAFMAKNISNIFGILDSVYSLAVLIPMLAIDFRRLHDTGRSGWFLLLWFVPIIGWIILLVYHCQPSEGPNIYGPEPKRK